MTRILVPLDGSPLAETILPFVEELVRRTGGQVTLLCVTGVRESKTATPDRPSIDEVLRQDAVLAERYLNDQRRRLTEAGIDAAVAVATGCAAAEIRRYVERAKVDLIALSTHGRSGVQAWAHGSVADEVLRTASIPVMLMRPGRRLSAVSHGIARIVVPLDGSSEAESALAVAEGFAARGDLPIVLIRCVEPLTLGFAADPHGIPYVDTLALLPLLEQEARGYLDVVAARLSSRGLTVSSQVSFGAAADSIASYAGSKPRSIVVMTTHARSAWRRFLLGSVARGVAHQVRTPVVFCPPPKSEGVGPQ